LRRWNSRPSFSYNFNNRTEEAIGTAHEALREVSPMLASRSGLSTAEEPMANVAAKLAELVAL
jgi:hypothetical protein